MLLDLFHSKVTSIWKELDFEIISYKESKDIFILGSVDAISTALDESLVTLNMILGSRYCGALREVVEERQKKLMVLSVFKIVIVRCP